MRDDFKPSNTWSAAFVTPLGHKLVSVEGGGRSEVFTFRNVPQNVVNVWVDGSKSLLPREYMRSYEQTLDRLTVGRFLAGRHIQREIRPTVLPVDQTRRQRRTCALLASLAWGVRA